MAESIIISSGESRDIVLLNRGTIDWHIVQERDSHLRLHIINTEPGDNSVTVEQTGAHCTTKLYALAFIGEQSCVRTRTRFIHKVGDGVSHQLVKFVLDGEAKGEFMGELQIAPDAQHVEALQTNRNILLSETATMRTRPQLEIYADDVKASHGASTGQLDESALFYMQQRGISPETGRQMLLRAFMADVVNEIADKEKREIAARLLDTMDSVVE